MQLEDTIPTPQIQSVTLYVYEGELEYDEHGNIKNQLRETLTYQKDDHGHCDDRQKSDS